jgi:DNA invertase Pin-like site-specific DNA recombinase
MSSTQNTKRIRLVGYARVSTAAQSAHGVSIPAQEEALAAWCAEHGHELVATFAEEGVSGAEGLEGRFAFVEALDMIQSGASDGLIVLELDRLSRDVIVQENLLRDVWAAGGRKRETFAFSTKAAETEQLVNDPTDPTRKLVRVMLGAIAEWDREKIKLRLQAARRAKHQRGGYCGGPTVGYGQLVEGSGREAVRVPDPDLADVVSRIHELRADGETFNEIAEALNADGVRTAQGSSWFPTSVRRVALRVAA